MGSADPLHRVHGRRLATVSGPVRKPHRRSSGGLQRAGEERVQEPSAEKGLREGGVCSWLPEVGTMQDARRQQNSIGHMWLGFSGQKSSGRLACQPLECMGLYAPSTGTVSNLQKGRMYVHMRSHPLNPSGAGEQKPPSQGDVNLAFSKSV